MKDNELKDTWQYRELKNYLEKIKTDEKGNSRALFLSNPKEKEEIDKIIRNHLWPGVLKGAGTSGIGIKSLEGTFPKSEIEDKREERTARKITFLLEDSRRHISYDSNVPWYCRGEDFREFEPRICPRKGFGPDDTLKPGFSAVVIGRSRC